MTILIADDDLVHVTLLCARLRQCGFKVLTAMDAMQAFSVALRNKPSAILPDFHMPGGTGLEVLKRLKTSAVTHQIPVIILSGNDDSKLAETLTALGADQIIKKPFEFEDVHRALCGVTAHHNNSTRTPLH